MKFTYSSISRIWSYITNFLQLQLFLTLFSWPILLLWGLPISIASPLGNLIFSPFIMLFLLISCLIFFTEIFYIPNGLLIVALDYISYCWIWLASWAQRSWLINCAQPPLVIAFAITLSALAVIHYKKLVHSNRRILLFFIILGLTFFYLKQIAIPKEQISNITCFEKEITLISANKKHVFIDPGYLGRRISAPSWVSYNLVPTLVKSGISQLDHVIILKPSAMTFRALNALCHKIDINNLYIVSWTGELNCSGWQAWEELLASVNKYKINLIKIDKDDLNIRLSDQEYLKIIPQNKEIKKNKLKYPAILISGYILDKNFNLESA